MRKHFQIFSHPHPPAEPFYGWMQRIRDWSDSYTLIAPQNFMGPMAHFVPISEVWAQVPQVLRESPHSKGYEFDAMRAWYLSEHFDHIYLDIDVQLFAPLEIQDMPLFDGPGVLMGNGDPQVGRKCWAHYLTLCPTHCRPASLMMAWGDCRNVPEEDRAKYRHHYVHGKFF